MISIQTLVAEKRYERILYTIFSLFRVFRGLNSYRETILQQDRF